MDKYIGKVLNERYMITEVIGIGGMSIVYKAFDQLVNRIVAIKILKEEFMSDAQFRRRFSNESKAITMLSLENIVDVYDVCLEGNDMYIVMEYIDGITLKQYIEKKKVIPWEEAIHYTKQILKAMAHAHARGIVHRDLKPQNIMLLQDGTIKVTDFGIARLSKYDSQTITDKAIGSVHYISPEQASGDMLDERTDIYSVGVMLYEMLTGTLPFEADNAVSVALMQVQSEPKLPREINNSIPQGLEDITINAMIKDPRYRYQTATEMLNDLIKVEENPFFTFGSRMDNINIENNQDNFDNEFDDDDMTIADEKLSEEKKEADLKKIWMMRIAGVVSALGVLTIIMLGILFGPNLFKKKTYAVPNFIGKNFDLVSTDEAYKNFELVKASERASEEDKGTILEQNITEGQLVKKGTKIELVVSSGYAKITIPNVVGQPKAEAVETLRKAGIQFLQEEKFSDSVKEGYVISTDPDEYTEINPDDVVTVYISLGVKEAEDVKVKVPDLKGKTQTQAKNALNAVSLALGSVSEEYSSTVAKGKVISQSISSGTEVSKDTPINIVISKGKKPEEKPKTVNKIIKYTFGDGYAGKTVKIELKLNDKEVLASNDSVVVDTLTDKTYSFDELTYNVGDRVYIYVDGELKKTEEITG